MKIADPKARIILQGKNGISMWIGTYLQLILIVIPLLQLNRRKYANKQNV